MKIIYKIVNTLLAITLIPIILFLPMFKFKMTVGLSSGNQLLSLLGSFIDVEKIIGSVTGVDISNLPEKYTVKEAYGMFFGENAKITAEGFDASVIPAEMTKFFTAAGVLFAIALVFAAIVMLLGLFTKKKGIAAGFSAVGFISAFAAGKCFDHIASQLISGKISMVNVISGLPAFEQYKSYIQYINIDIRLFKLDTAFNMVLVVLAALFIVNVLFIVTDQVSEKA